MRLLTGAYQFGLLGGEEKTKFELHLTHCSYCFNELYSNQPIVNGLKAGAPRFVAQLETLTAQKAKSSVFEKFLSLLTVRQYATVTGIIIATSFLTIYYLERPKPADFVKGEQTKIERGVEIYQPKGKTQGIPAGFHWQSVLGTQYYEVEIYDQQGKSLCRLRADSNFLTLPERIRGILVPSVEYFWEVRAYSADSLLLSKSRRIGFAVMNGH